MRTRDLIVEEPRCHRSHSGGIAPSQTTYMTWLSITLIESFVFFFVFLIFPTTSPLLLPLPQFQGNLVNADPTLNQAQQGNRKHHLNEICCTNQLLQVPHGVMPLGSIPPFTPSGSAPCEARSDLSRSIACVPPPEVVLPS